MYGLPHTHSPSPPSQPANLNTTSCPRPDHVRWIFDAFHQCVYNLRAEVGLCIGLLSIACWMSAGFPQVVANFKTKKVHEAWSIYSLLLWLCGDSCNLIGCLLVHQLPVQVYTSFYYVGMDFIIISQYVYCYCLHRNLPEQSVSIFEGAANGPWSPRAHRRGTVVVTCLLLLGAPLLGGEERGGGVEEWRRRSSRALLQVDDSVSPAAQQWSSLFVAGFSIGCISAVLYLASRVPQILKNFRRKKTDGVCYTLFMLAAVGNSLYGASILLQDPPEGMSRSEFILRQSPWLVGSLGTMFLDSFIIFQIFFYTRRQKILAHNAALLEAERRRLYEDIPEEGARCEGIREPLVRFDRCQTVYQSTT